MTGHIYIEGEIGQKTTAETVRAQINNKLYDSYDIHFNSIGGDVYEGYQIGAILLNIGKPTTAIVEGMCASIATYDACCCDKIVMMPHSEWMIHDPIGTVQGGSEDFRQAAGQLDRIKTDIISRYMTKVSRKGVTREQLASMMDKETSMSATIAQTYGFADEVSEKLKAVAKLDITKMEPKDKGLLEKAVTAIEDKLNKLFNIIKPKNMINATLDNGQVIMVMADNEDWTNAPVTYEDGTPLPAGDYTTVDGIQFTVDANSTITQVIESAANSNDMQQVEALQKEIETLKAQLAAKDESIKSMEAQAKQHGEFKAAIEKEFAAVKKETEDMKKKVFGEDGTGNQKRIENQQQDRHFDPMAEELGNAFISSRRW